MADAGQGRTPAGSAQAAADGEAGWAQRKLAQRFGRAAEAPASASAVPDGAAALSVDDKRTSDRRREERRTGLATRARVAFRGRDHEVPVFNLSRRGAMIGTGMNAKIGERIAIQFPDCNPIHGVVRWTEEDRTGVEFAQQTALLIPAHWRMTGGRRSGEVPTESAQLARPPRHKLMWECELHWGRGIERARVRNISAEGAMIDGSRNVPIGTEVVLALRSAGTISGTVQWARSGQIGLKFDRAFDLKKVLAPAGFKASTSDSPARPGILKPLYLESELDPSSPWAARQDKLQRNDFK